MRKSKFNPAHIRWLQTAIASEKRALADYLDYALLTRDRSGKDMFIKLAHDEYQHMELLGKELDRLQSGHAWQKARIPSSAIEEIIPLLKKKGIVSEGVAQKNEVQVITLAIEAEKKAMSFYQSKAEEIANVSARALLKRLAEMEHAHYQILQSELDNITRTGLWMGVREVPFEAE